jgi:hypothetical protein
MNPRGDKTIMTKTDHRRTNSRKSDHTAANRASGTEVGQRRGKSGWTRRIVVGEGEGNDSPTLFRSFNHRIKVIGTTEFHDYEWIGDDEHGEFGFLQETVLSTSGPSAELLKWKKGFGGEERVEIEIQGSLQSDNGDCIVTIRTEFFEGATEGTTESEDSDVFVTVVPMNHTSNFDVHLANNEDDWARISGSIANTRI